MSQSISAPPAQATVPVQGQGGTGPEPRDIRSLLLGHRGSSFSPARRTVLTEDTGQNSALAAPENEAALPARAWAFCPSDAVLTGRDPLWHGARATPCPPPADPTSTRGRQAPTRVGLALGALSPVRSFTCSSICSVPPPPTFKPHPGVYLSGFKERGRGETSMQERNITGCLPYTPSLQTEPVT